jgi:PAP2 superfamily
MRLPFAVARATPSFRPRAAVHRETELARKYSRPSAGNISFGVAVSRETQRLGSNVAPLMRRIRTLDQKGMKLSMRRTMLLLTLLGATAVIPSGTLSAGFVVARVHDDHGASASHVNPVVQWNRTLLAIVRTPKAQPATIHPTRSFAIMHAAIYDAVNAIEKSHRPYRVRAGDVPAFASQDAAAATAAHDVLAALYPQFLTTLDTQLEDALADLSFEDGVIEGIHVGQIVAARMLALRENDGSGAQPIPYVFGTNPGDYQSTPPNSPPQPQFTHWSHVAPFALPRANFFRPAPPPELTSDRYGNALNEVQSLGTADGTSTPDQALVGRFWNGPIQNYWNEIAQTVTEARHMRTADRARLFALLNFAIADGVIAFYDAKYIYNRWRPVTAVRAADTDGNPDTVGDPNWLPEVGNTTPDPSYPGAHAVVSAAALNVLVATLRRDRFALTVTSEILPGVTRSFDSISAAANEATLSRIFAGVHFRFDETSGRRLGRRIGTFVVENLLTRSE